MKNKFLTILFGISVAIAILTFCIGLPIYCRFFYYLQISPLKIDSITGYSIQEIKIAYNEMLNYLVLPNKSFSAGVFSYTENFALHMAAVKKLFTLNLVAFIISFTIIIVLLVLEKIKKIRLCKPFNLGVSFFSCLSLISTFIVIGVLCVIDSDKAFIIFHDIFFMGENWIFDPSTDPIINVLPEQFFFNCGILILVSMIIICIIIIIYQLIKRKKLN